MMKTRKWAVPVIAGLGLMLILALQWAAGTLDTPAEAAPFVAAPHAPTAGELHVCLLGFPTCDYDNIQAAVDAAAVDTTIKVAAGVYTDIHVRETVTQVVYINKTLSIEGGYTPLDWNNAYPEVNLTVLNAQGLGRGMFITGSASVVIDGLHITGGDATGLGGGYDEYAYDGVGGGIYVFSATASISNCLIYDNVASQSGRGAGGGVYLYYSDSALSQSVVYSNTASTMTSGGAGGGVALAMSNAVLSGNTIRDNTACTLGDGQGGGIYMQGDSPAMVAYTPTLSSNIVQRNVASRDSMGDGGGIFATDWANAELENTVLIENHSGSASFSRGAGLAVNYSALTLLHTTVQGNTGVFSDGIGLFSGMAFAMTNTILVSQSVGVNIDQDATAVIDYVLWSGVISKTWGGGTFYVSNEYTGSPAFGLDGYHLLPNSMAIDKGLDVGVDDDVDGQSRPYGPAPDLGADEWICDEALTGVEIMGPTAAYTDTPLPFAAAITPLSATQPVTYAWSPKPDAGQGLPLASYSWTDPGIKTIAVAVGNCGGTFFDTHPVTVSAPPIACPLPLLDVEIVGPIWSLADVQLAYVAAILPFDATGPVTYTWSPEPEDGQGTAVAAYRWSAAGNYTLTVSAENCGGLVSDTQAIAVETWVSATIDPAIGGKIVYTDTQGVPTIIEIPPGALIGTTMLSFTPVLTPSFPMPPGECFGGRAFNLDAYCSLRYRAYLPLVYPQPYRVYLPLVLRHGPSSVAAGQNALPLSFLPAAFTPLASDGPELEPCSPKLLKPIKITIYYTDANVACVADEKSLKLYYWTGSEWQDAAGTCSAADYLSEVSPAQNKLEVNICHLSQFALGGR